MPILQEKLCKEAVLNTGTLPRLSWQQNRNWDPPNRNYLYPQGSTDLPGHEGKGKSHSCRRQWMEQIKQQAPQPPTQEWQGAWGIGSTALAYTFDAP